MAVLTKGEEEAKYRSSPRTANTAFFGDEAVKTFAIPSIAATYNDEMNHVDRGDQLRASRGYSHSIRRGPWQAIAWTFLLDTALINSYLLQLHGQPKWKKIRSQSDWRGRLIDDCRITFV